MKKYILNKYLRIFINNEGDFLLKEALTKKETLLEKKNFAILSVLSQLSQPLSKVEIITLLRKSFDEVVSNIILENFLRYKYIVPENSKVIKQYNNFWEFYGWEDFAYYIEKTSQEKYLENGSITHEHNVRETIYANYLKKDPAPLKLVSGTDLEATIKLAKPIPLTRDYFETIFSRRTIRRYNSIPITMVEFSTILYFGFNELRKVKLRLKETTKNINFSDSYLISHEAYVVIYSVETLVPGLYVYNILEHSLTLVKRGEFYSKVKKIVAGQAFAEESSFSLFITTIFEQVMWRYRSPHHYSKMLIDVAELAQQLITAAIALDIGTFQTPAILDSEANQFLGTHELVEEATYYLAFGNFDKK